MIHNGSHGYYLIWSKFNSQIQFYFEVLCYCHAAVKQLCPWICLHVLGGWEILICERYLGVHQDERCDKYKMPLFLPVLSSGYPVLVVNGRGPGPWGSAEGTFIISLTANVMWGFMEVLRDPIKKNSSESKPAQSGFSRGNSPLCWYVCVCH